MPIRASLQQRLPPGLVHCSARAPLARLTRAAGNPQRPIRGPPATKTTVGAMQATGSEPAVAEAPNPQKLPVRVQSEFFQVSGSDQASCRLAPPPSTAAAAAAHRLCAAHACLACSAGAQRQRHSHCAGGADAGSDAGTERLRCPLCRGQGEPRNNVKDALRWPSRLAHSCQPAAPSLPCRARRRQECSCGCLPRRLTGST